MFSFMEAAPSLTVKPIKGDFMTPLETTESPVLMRKNSKSVRWISTVNWRFILRNNLHLFLSEICKIESPSYANSMCLIKFSPPCITTLFVESCINTYFIFELRESLFNLKPVNSRLLSCPFDLKQVRSSSFLQEKVNKVMIDKITILKCVPNSIFYIICFCPVRFQSQKYN